MRSASVQHSPPGPAGPRWWRYVHRKQLVCPAGHHFKNVVRINETGFIQCLHFINDGSLQLGDRGAEGTRCGHECGLWVFVMPIRGGRAIVVEVAESEADAMDDLQTPSAMIDYLGIFEPSALARISAPVGSHPAPPDSSGILQGRRRP